MYNGKNDEQIFQFHVKNVGDGNFSRLQLRNIEEKGVGRTSSFVVPMIDISFTGEILIMKVTDF